MNKPSKALDYLDKCGFDLKGKQAEKVATALQIAFEEGKGVKATTIFNFETYEKFRAAMKIRLSQPGLVRTGDAWKEAKGVTGYGSICNMMRYTMEKMEEENKAGKIRRGVWIIY